MKTRLYLLAVFSMSSLAAAANAPMPKVECFANWDDKRALDNLPAVRVKDKANEKKRELKGFEITTNLEPGGAAGSPIIAWYTLNMSIEKDGTSAHTTTRDFSVGRRHDLRLIIGDERVFVLCDVTK